MYIIDNDYSLNYNQILNHLLKDIVRSFYEIGSSLPYNEIYATVFPIHMQTSESKKTITTHLQRIYTYIADSFSHNFTSLDEYIIYEILNFMYEATKDDRIIYLDESIKENLSIYPYLTESERTVLSRIRTINELIDLCFEDIDFLDVGILFDTFKSNPEIFEELYSINLDYYRDIMPPDILIEYNSITTSKKNNPISSLPINDISNFKDTIINCVKEFEYQIKYKEINKILNPKKTGPVSEVIVQIIFDTIISPLLAPYKILVSREIHTARGTIDFHFSIGTDYQGIIEIKLSTNPNKQTGLLYQLPTYMIGKKVDFGIYLLICFDEDSYTSSSSLKSMATDLSLKYNKDIHFMNILVPTEYVSASKIKSSKDM